MEDLAGKSWSGNEVPRDITFSDIWYMVYRDDNNEIKTVKGTTESIRRNLMAGVLGRLDAIQVSRSKTGQFVSLRSTAEFRDLVLSNTPTPISTSRPTPTLDKATVSNSEVSRNEAPSQARKRTPSSSLPDDITAFEGMVTLPEQPSSSTTSRTNASQYTSTMADNHPRIAFDWGALLLIVVAIAATGLGLLLFTK